MNWNLKGTQIKLSIIFYVSDVAQDRGLCKCCAFIILSFHRTVEMMMPLRDPNSLEEDMGVVVVDVSLSVKDRDSKKNVRNQIS